MAGLASLPVIIFLVSQSYEQIPCNILEQRFVLFGEVFLPTAGLPGAEGMTFLRLDGID
jgi:hypothetical protein